MESYLSFYDDDHLDSVEANDPKELIPPDKLSDKQSAHTFQITVNQRLQRADGWAEEVHNLDDLQRLLTHHSESDTKEKGRAFVPGSLIGDRRSKSAVSQLSLLVLDLDKGDDIEVVRAAIKSQGLHAIVYSTHSHLTTETPIKLNDYRKFSGLEQVDADYLKAYLTEKCGYRPDVVERATVIEEVRETEHGLVCVAGHHPLQKYRIVFPLKEPFRRDDFAHEGRDQSDFETQWEPKYSAVANSLKVAWDTSCSEISRAFYAPSCKPGALRFSEVIEGKLLDLNDFAVSESMAASTTQTRGRGQTVHRRANESASTRSPNLTTWIAQYGPTFEIETALRESAPPEIFRGRRPEGGAVIQCPFEDTHSQWGGRGTFVVNASENGHRGFGLHCSHEHCLSERGDGARVDRLEFLHKMLDDGWLTIDDLSNPELGGGPVSSRLNNRDNSGRDLRVLDREGAGIDVSVFFSKVVKTGRLAFTQLNQLCNIQTAQDITAEQLADFIEADQVTCSSLMACIRADSTANRVDPYFDRLIELAKQKASGDVTANEIEKLLAAARVEFGVKQRAVEADFRTAEKRLQSVDNQIGLLSAVESKLIKPLRDYVKQYAIINTGGKAMVMNLNEPDLSKALMARSDFELLHQNEWINDGRSLIYPAKEFMSKPPKNTRVYRGGFVFRPSGTVPADQFNLYKGMLIAPDSSGSCSLFYQLIEQVWANGDQELADWLREWLWHIVAHPGTKVGTTIAIRGEPGDGKSIVFEQLLSRILGDTLLRVTNHKMILGDFNESLIGKLVTVLEEAAFSGDKHAFDQMKELITGDKILINPKFKAPITVDNFSRLVVISNHDHFLHIKPGDRRYLVLESTGSWRGTAKFEAMVDQWKSGGAAKFMHDALHHSFRRLDDGKRLQISKVLRTSASVRQLALSRSSLEKLVVEFVLTGSVSGPTGDLIVFDKEGQSIASDWALDKHFEIGSQDLQHWVLCRLHKIDPSAARHSVSLHTVIGTLHRYIGASEEVRPKGRNEGGNRIQLPTVRRLPPRRNAIQHAWDSGLITEEEFQAAVTGDSEAVEAAQMTLEEDIESHEEVLKFNQRLKELSPLSVTEELERERQGVLPFFSEDGVRGSSPSLLPI